MKKLFITSIALVSLHLHADNQTSTPDSILSQEPECSLITQYQQVKKAYQLSGGSDFDFSKSTQSVKQFNDVVDYVEKTYKPIFAKKGRTLQISTDWQDPEINAGALMPIYNNGISGVFLTGGLFRIKEMTSDGYMAVLCHELGHHLGGSPLKPSSASAESQADYYATNVCLPLLFKNLDNKSYLAVNKPTVAIIQSCNSVYPKYSDENLICQRVQLAAKTMTNFLASANQSSFSTDLHAHDNSQVKENYVYYPSVQCRYDTLIAGSLCNKKELINPIDGQNLNCSATQFMQSKGARPGCWFYK